MSTVNRIIIYCEHINIKIRDSLGDFVRNHGTGE